MIAVYYLDGVRYQIWADSSGYFVQALGITGEMAYSRPGNRQFGYPLIIAATLSTPAPLLVLVALQALAAALALAGVYWALMRWAMPILPPGDAYAEKFRAAILIGVGLASLYSIVHVQIAAMLTEAFFSSLALAAVLATIWYARLAPGTKLAWVTAAMVGVVIGLNLVVKPHWLFAAIALGLVVAVQLWRLTPAADATWTRQSARIAVALVIPLAAVHVVALPDRVLGGAYSQRDQLLFGPRAVFCNHLHMISATLRRRAGLSLQDQAQFEAQLRDYMRDVQQRSERGWRRLGFNGDLCSYDVEFTALLDARFPDPRAQADFLLGAVRRAALADPLPYAAKVLWHISYGFTAAFEKFAHHARPGSAPGAYLLTATGQASGIDTGIRVANDIGPLGSEDTLKGTLVGRIVHAGLAIIFFGLTGLLCGLAIFALAGPWLYWRAWSGPARRDYLTLVAIPLLALVAHHALVALTHSFDIWRYGFNMYYVNLLFIGSTALFARRYIPKAGQSRQSAP